MAIFVLTKRNSKMTNSEQALNKTIEIVKYWLQMGITRKVALLRLTEKCSLELAEKVVRLAELAL